MAISTITWNQVFELARNMGAKKVQVGNNDVLITQFVMAKMYTYHPWKFSLVNDIDTIPLVSGQQDYPAPPNIYRLTQAWVHVLYPGSVDQNYNLDVVWNLTPDLNPTGFYGNGQIFFMQKQMLYRLTNASQVITGSSGTGFGAGGFGDGGFGDGSGGTDPTTQAFLNSEYQPQPDKITDMSQWLPFPDEYADIAAEGVLYWLYKFGDDERAGTMVYLPNGTVEYTGQLGIFMGQLKEMAGKEMVGAGDTIFPSEMLGQRWWGERPPLGPWW